MKKYITLRIDIDMTVNEADLFLFFPETISKVADPTLSGYDLGEVEDLIGYDLFCIVEDAAEPAFWQGIFKRREGYNSRALSITANLLVRASQFRDQIRMEISLEGRGGTLFSFPTRYINSGDSVTIHNATLGLTFDE
jgi:hypothetical protein